MFTRAHPLLINFVYELRAKHFTVENEISKGFNCQNNVSLEVKKREKMLSVINDYEKYYDIFYLKSIAILFSVNYEKFF